MGRHKKTVVATDEDREKYDKYIEPNHALIKNTVSMLTLKSNEINDNFQDICIHLLRYIGSLDPEKPVANWIITSVRREVGKLEAAKDSYVDASKGSDFEYVTEHSGYKKRYRPKKAKDFVNSYDDTVFRSDPNEMVHDGADDRIMEVVQNLMPEYDFGTGSYRDVLSTIQNSSDTDIKILFMMYYDGIKVRDISLELGLSERDVKNALGRARGRVIKAKEK